MNDRRDHARVMFLESVAGVVRGFADVVVQKSGESEWIAISRLAAIAGEMLFLDFTEDERPRHVAVCVVESRPVVLDGDVRYRIRLQADEAAPIRYEQQIRRG